MYEGYSFNVPFTVNNISSFAFVQSDGNCETSSSSSNLHFTLKFKVDLKLTCKSTSNTINMFSSFLGKSVYRYYNYVNSS